MIRIIASAALVAAFAVPASAQVQAVTTSSSSFAPASRGGGTWSFRSETVVGRAAPGRGSVDAENNWNATPDAWKRVIVIDGKRRLVAVTPCGGVHVDFLDGRYLREECR